MKLSRLLLVTALGAGTLVLIAQTIELPAKLKPLDRDGDGRLSAAEFFDADLFHKIDTDGDGYATPREIYAYYLKNPPQSSPPAKKGSPAPTAPAERRSPEETFEYLDHDADGKLSLAEFEQLNDVVPAFRDRPEMARGIFARIDANKDGLLSLEEFRMMYRLAGAGAAAAQPMPKAALKPPVEETSAKPATVSSGPLKPEEIAFFEKNIRPVLADKCYKCHAADAEKIRGGLVLDTRDGIRAGGDGGPAVVPGDVAKSLLIEAIRYTNEDFQMPPEKHGGKLPDGVIRNFEQWVQMGAPDPRDGARVVKSIDYDKARQFWAFQPVKSAPPPAVRDTAWPRSDLDRFLLAEMEAKKVKPVGDADRRALLRRVTFDLTGLPPTPDQIDAFLADQNADAFARVVDRLLATPQYGERWGRHWLDVARYADSSGRGSNILYPEAWRYRDYVIAAFNADKPYDQFLREQIAGDLLPAKNDQERADHLVATGFLALGAKELAEKDRLQFQLDLVDEQLDTVGQAMLGLTVGCARCHDHKFDPISQRDYTSLAGIFRSTETCYGTVAVVTNTHASPLVELPACAPRVDVATLPTARLKSEQTRLDAELRKLTGGYGLETYQLPPEADKLRPFIQVRSQLIIVNARLRDLGPDGQPRPFAMGAREKTNPADMPLYQRGEPSKPGAVVSRGFLQVVAKGGEPIKSGSGRRELANWIASPENPLTARVMVNRVWHHLFGRGLVPSVDNFGAMGERPSHPALLDRLATDFVDQGWSVKQLIREIVLTRSYQLATTFDAANDTIDPDNALVWRMRPRRLDAEALRDAMLAVSGRLDLRAPQGSVAARLGNNFVNAALQWTPMESTSGMRSVYLTIIRDQVNETLRVFDFANSNAVTGLREETTTPAQTLFLMNSPVMQSFAESWAKRLALVPGDGNARLSAAYVQAFGRAPTTAEREATHLFFAKFLATAGEDDAKRKALLPQATTAYCQALFASAEFRTLN